ncbi:MAG: beta-ketoacyl synthase N-terminal-like domain-containing protein, partial [bacterium]
MSDHMTGFEIAIVGMAGRFPGANGIEAFWDNLRNGVESVSFFTDEELVAAGVDPAAAASPDCIKAGAVLEDIDMFDAAFFGISPREAEIMDPQHRLLLECAWEDFENAGYHIEKYNGLVGVYAGVGMNTYLLNNILAHHGKNDALSGLPFLTGNDKDHVPTRVSYKLNLDGPSVNVQTACSTSLVATHLACQALLAGECDMALAGGVSISVPQKTGYHYQKQGIYSPDGHCRAFDAKAEGTVGGNGVAAVVLKRLETAIADGDHIFAVIKGSAINNDGAAKIGYTAPGIDGQTKVIRRALA